MNILIYKRTHIGDPDENGNFGIHNCMGQVRGYNFDAVIGVGGIGSEPKKYGIDRKINWVGIGAKRNYFASDRPPIVTFEQFFLFEEKGILLDDIAPNLALRMYKKGARILLHGYSDIEKKEAVNIINDWIKQHQALASSASTNKPQNDCAIHGCMKKTHCRTS